LDENTQDGRYQLLGLTWKQAEAKPKEGKPPIKN